MSELNLQNQGPRRRKQPENNAPNPFRMLMLLAGIIFMAWIFSRAVSQSAAPRDQGEPVPADYKPPQPQPARAVDDGLGTLIIFPPTMRYRADEIDEEMKKAKDAWKKEHPDRIVVAVLNNTRDPLDYGYRWVIFYETR